MDLILRIGYQWVFHEDLISQIRQKFGEITNICLVNNFCP